MALRAFETLQKFAELENVLKDGSPEAVSCCQSENLDKTRKMMKLCNPKKNERKAKIFAEFFKGGCSPEAVC